MTGTLLKLDFVNHNDKTLECYESWLNCNKEIGDISSDQEDLSEAQITKLSNYMEKESDKLWSWFEGVLRKHEIDKNEVHFCQVSEPVFQMRMRRLYR